MEKIKKIILGFILFLLILLLTIMSVRVDSRNKVESKIEDLNNVIENREGEQLEYIFLAETLFHYNGETYYYPDLENNIKESLEANNPQLIREGFAIDQFKGMGNLEADVILIADVKMNDILSKVSVNVKVKRVGIFEWRISELDSNDPDFAYLFINYLIKE